MIKIQSFSDVITNSSSSVFVVYTESNIKSIKDTVNAILAIDSEYTFDDLFDISMSINTDLLEDCEGLEEEFKELMDLFNDKNLTWRQTITKVNEIVDSYDSEKKNRLSELLWNVVDEDDYESCVKSPYDGIIITPKDPDNEVVSRAAIAISNLSDIFDIDFCYG